MLKCALLRLRHRARRHRLADAYGISLLIAATRRRVRGENKVFA